MGRRRAVPVAAEPFPVLDPTHPDGPRKMLDPRPVLCSSTARSTGCGHPVEWHVGAHTPNPSCDCCSWRQNVPSSYPDGKPSCSWPEDCPTVESCRMGCKVPHRGQRYTDPLPPPAGLDVDPEKWRRMPRAERRAMMRGRKR